jgi:hypothetical protein
MTSKSKLPDWYEAGERATEAEIERIIGALEFIEDIPANADWRWCMMPRAALLPALYDDRETFIYQSERNDLEEDRETFEDWEKTIGAAGIEAHFKANPAPIYMHGKKPDILDDTYPLGAAIHGLNATAIPVLVAFNGECRFLPRERAKAWKDDPGWSAHALDAKGPRFEDELSLRGAMRKTAFIEIIGEIDGAVTAERVQNWLEWAREWTGDARDEWLDQEPVFPMTRSPKMIENMDAAATEVIEFLERCAEIGMGVVVGRAAAKYKPPRENAA